MTSPKATRARLIVLLVLTVSAFQGCSTPATPVHPTVTPDLIVQQNANDAFDVFLTDQDRPALQELRNQIAGAQTRQDLTALWNGIPALAAKGSDFLNEHVFSKAVAEAKWPKDGPVTDLESAFVTGTRLAVDEFLRKGSH